MGDPVICTVLFIIIVIGFAIAIYYNYCQGNLENKPPSRKWRLEDDKYKALIRNALYLSSYDVLNILDCLLIDFESRIALEERSPVDREFQAVYAAKRVIYEVRRDEGMFKTIAKEPEERPISLYEKSEIISDFLLDYIDMVENVHTDVSYKGLLSRKMTKRIKANRIDNYVNSIIRNVLEYEVYNRDKK